MSAKTQSIRLSSAIIGTGVLQIVQTQATAKHISMMCRQVPGQEKVWLSSIEDLLTAYEGLKAPVAELIIARRYVLKEGKLAFGWYISLAGTSKTIDSLIEVFEEVLANASPSATPQASIPLTPPSAASAEPQSQRRFAPGEHPPPSSRAKAPSAEDLIPSQSQVPPPNFTPKIRVVSTGRDEKGNMTSTEEMPLPHIHQRELNRVNAKGRGAKPLG